MTILSRLKRRVRRFIERKRETEPAAAYDLWALTYDDQPDNPILLLDELIVRELLAGMDLAGKKIVDVGCGTGRHWEKLLSRKPSELVGYEVSAEMLRHTGEKYPDARTYLYSDNKLTETAGASCDLVFSTLVIAHIKDLGATLREWDRVLAPHGEIIITDFHPVALQRGANRSFLHKDRLVYIRSHVHTLRKLRQLARQLGWEETAFLEMCIDERVKPIFERLNQMEAYEDSLDQLILYGMRLRKR